MVRAAVLSITFIVAVGPCFPMLCNAWCATRAAEAGCDHGDHGGTTRIEKNDSCQDQVPVAALNKEDARRRIAPEEQVVWAVARATSRAHLSELRPLDRPIPQRSDQRTTGLTPLRI